MDLVGTTALVTGGARRVGKAISLALARAGCDLLLHYHRSSAAAEEVAGEAEALGSKVGLVGVDVADPAAAETVIAAAEELAPLRVLVNSAAIFPDDTLLDVSPEDWRRTLAVNLEAPVFLTQAFARAMPSDGEGAVVNVTDWRVERPYPDHFSYTVAKGALDVFTQTAAEALAPRIRVNGVALGAMLPPPGKDSAYLKALAMEIPLERIGGAEVVADAVLFLLHSDFITGEIIRLDGGAHLR
jgi:glucose 1-dehydrogenase